MWREICQFLWDRPLEAIAAFVFIHYIFNKLHEKKEQKRKKSNSLFLKLGGDETLQKCVDIFYSKVLDSKLTSHFFNGLDLSRQKRMMFNFLAYSFHSPHHDYDGRNMSDAHKNLVLNKGLSDEHFDEMAKLMKESLLELGISDHLVSQVVKQVENIRPEILCRKGCYEPH